MSAAELAQDVQFTVDSTGQVTAVVLTPKAWQRIVEALEDAEDLALARALRSRLVQGPVAAGALRFGDVAGEWH